MSVTQSSDFIRNRIIEDNASGRYDGIVKTRFPPEPNGYMHLGHAKAVWVDFGIAADFGGTCNLRMDDTNPLTEESHYIDGFREDLAWLGYQWEGDIRYASDYFDQLYAWAQQLVRQGDAYVDDLSPEEAKAYRGTITEAGTNSPHRERTVEENLDLLERMKNGEFAAGEKVLRAKIDMAHPNMVLRDPIMYRIIHAAHYRTGDKWCIYPTYDWAHGQSDSIEGITHSLCSLEFQVRRPLYEWYLEKLGIHAPQQIEFARLDVSHIITSKRRLRQLVEAGAVTAWDDPRMPTIRGMRRRGYTPESLINFVESAGLAKAEGVVDYQQLEHFVRDHLNEITPRTMAVLDPLKLIITNYPEGESEMVDVASYPQDKENATTRPVPFAREIYIEREDFREEANKKYKRMVPGREIRLFGAYFVTATEAVKDEDGNITTVYATYDPETKGGNAADGRRPKGTIHWVAADHAVAAELRLYDRLFTAAKPGAETGDIFHDINPDSLTVVTGYVEPALQEAAAGDRFQFMRTGYFAVDPDSTAEKLVFNRTITLRDTWAKISA